MSFIFDKSNFDHLYQHIESLENYVYLGEKKIVFENLYINTNPILDFHTVLSHFGLSVENDKVDITL